MPTCAPSVPLSALRIVSRHQPSAGKRRSCTSSSAPRPSRSRVATETRTTAPRRGGGLPSNGTFIITRERGVFGRRNWRSVPTPVTPAHTCTRFALPTLLSTHRADRADRANRSSHRARLLTHATRTRAQARTRPTVTTALAPSTTTRASTAHGTTTMTTATVVALVVATVSSITHGSTAPPRRPRPRPRSSRMRVPRPRKPSLRECRASG